MGNTHLAELSRRVLLALLTMQRRSWEQGLTGQALLALGRFDLAAVLAADAVANQLPDGRLADLGDRNVVNGAAAIEAVQAVARRNHDDSCAAALARQVGWLLHAAPRAADGTLMHVLDRRQVWSDTVYMVVPSLIAVGRTDLALQQLSGHRRRLQESSTGLFAHIWDEDRQELARAAPWGGGNGWVAAGCAKALRLLCDARPAGTEPDATTTGFEAAAAECARQVLDACVQHRSAAGLFHDIVDDPATFEEVTLAAMLAYTAFTGTADGWLPERYRDLGDSLIGMLMDHVDEDGLLRPACGTPSFDRPGISAEAQAWFLLAVTASDPYLFVPADV